MGVQHDLNRKTIDSKIYIPYGLEIETEGIEYELGSRVLSHKITDDWKLKDDKTLVGGGIELVSPVLENNKKEILRLKKIAKTLDHLDATFEHASIQLNFDAYDLTHEDIIYLLKIFAIYENIIYRFSCGTDETLRASIRYALPLSSVFFYSYKDSVGARDSYDALVNNKSFALSLKTKTRNSDDPIKVIEFRTPNGTSDFYLWMNYIVFFSSFLTCINKKRYDKEYIDYLFSKLEFFKKVEDLILVDKDKAKEFAQLIYLSDREKECFFRQYYDKKILKK